ncbi:MAG: viroplasmin family protein [Tannerellaceae bacterium]|nr:viroplasmin family protein [Tannerellaceae bacterium]
MGKSKYYVVWKGLTPGIYESWEECKKQVEGQPDVRYKSFETREEAVNAFEEGPPPICSRKSGEVKKGVISDDQNKPVKESISVDAACSGNPGDMEYRGVYTATGQEIFHLGPLKMGTNNIGEFLALVHGLALLKQKGSTLPIYTDSRNAMVWVQKKKCKTLLERIPENEEIFQLIERAEKWLRTNTYTTPIYKWETKKWGEIPADFGRK